MLILQGAHFGTNKRAAKKMWRSAPHGYGLAYVRNSMTANAFEFMRSFIHFANNNERAPRNHPNYDPLHKVRHMLNTIMDGIRKAWSAGMNITIDESMIR